MATPSSSERDTQLLSVGKQCSDPACLLIDFLPFKCQHCQLSFCQEHFKVDAHKCSKYDDRKFNRVAPNCKLVSLPIAWQRLTVFRSVMQYPCCNTSRTRPQRSDGHSPRERMLCGYWQSQGKDNPSLCSPYLQEGSVLSNPLHSRFFSQMNELLFTPVQSCTQQFCPAHRFPGDHSCSGPVPVPTKPNTFANLNSGAKNLNSKASEAGAAALHAVKKTMAAAVIPDPKPSGSSSRLALPFNKMDR